MRELYQKNKLFFLILIAAAIGFLVWYFSNIVIFIIVAGVISIVGAPLVEMLDRIKVGRFAFPHVLSVALALLMILLLFFGMFSLFIPLVVNEATMISNIDGKQFMAYYQSDIAGLQHMLIHYGIMPRGTTLESAAKQAILKIIDFGLCPECDSLWQAGLCHCIIYKNQHNQ